MKNIIVGLTFLGFSLLHGSDSASVPGLDEALRRAWMAHVESSRWGGLVRLPDDVSEYDDAVGRAKQLVRCPDFAAKSREKDLVANLLLGKEELRRAAAGLPAMSREEQEAFLANVKQGGEF